MITSGVQGHVQASFLNTAFMKKEVGRDVYDFHSFKTAFIDGCFTVRGRLIQNDRLDADPAANKIVGQIL